MFKKFFGLVSLVGLVGAGALGACTVEPNETPKADGGVDSGPAKKDAGDGGPVTTPDGGGDAPACYDEANGVAIPAGSIVVENQAGKCTDAQLTEFGTVCSSQGGNTAECDKYTRETSADAARKACGTCLLGSVDASKKLLLGAFTTNNSGYIACLADKLGVKAACAAPLASEYICIEGACTDCTTEADDKSCQAAAADGPCASVLVTDDSACGKAFTAAANDAAKLAAAKTACGGDATTLVDFTAKLGAYYCK